MRATATELAQHPVDVHFEVAAGAAAEPALDAVGAPEEPAPPEGSARLLNDGAVPPVTGAIEHVERARL